MDSSAPPPPAENRCVPETDNLVIVHGYPVIAATECDGWYFGAMNPFLNDHIESSGDGYVVTPDGSRADLLWQIGEGMIEEVLASDDDRWGVYSVWFPKEIRCIDDLVFGFRYILPDLQKLFAGLSNN